MAIKIEGIALYSGYSLNGYYFTIDALKDGHNVNVPLYLEHDYTKRIGEITYYFDEYNALLRFEGYIDYENLSKDLQEEVDSHLENGAKVSVGCEVLEYSVLSNVDNVDESVKEYILITHVKFVELSIVMNPSFPLTTLDVTKATRKAIAMPLPISNKVINYVTCSITSIDKGIREENDKTKDCVLIYNMDGNMTNTNDEKPISNVIEHKVDERIELLKRYIERKANHIKFSINAIDASPFATRSEIGIAPRPTIVSGNVEEFLNRGVVEGKKATWVVVPIVEWSTFVDGSTPNDATQIISEVEEVVSYRGYRQSVSDLAKLVAPIDLVGELVRLEKSMVAYEIDKEIFAKRSGASTILQENVPFSYTHLLKAIRIIRANGGVGEIVALLPPKAFHELLEDLNASTYGDNTPFASKDGIYEVHVFGARVRMTSREVIDSVGGINYLRSIIFLSGSIGVALGDLEVEIFRDGNALKDVITIKKAFALKYLNPMHIVVQGTQA